MISLLIGGTVVLCIGLLAVVFGIPIKEFSFGNTMILAGAGVSCTGLILIGLYFVGREVRALAQRLESGAPALPNPVVSRERVSAPPKPHAPHEDTLFSRDQPSDPALGRDEFTDLPSRDNRARGLSPLAEPVEAPAPWQDHPVTRAPAPVTEAFELPAEPAERPRRNIMFSSHRRDASRDLRPRDSALPVLDEPVHPPVADEAPDRDAEAQSAPETESHSATQPADPFDSAWPQPAARSRVESPVRNRRAALPPDEEDHAPPEIAEERVQPPRRSDESSVTVVKSGVVDSMAYSLYSDGSIEAQMPEGMVRFASIDELRAHLDERG